MLSSRRRAAFHPSAGGKSVALTVGAACSILGVRARSEMAKPSDDVPGRGAPSGPGQPPAKRHPLFGWWRGAAPVAPRSDLTEPADPEWAGRIGNECPAPPYVRGRFDRE